MPAVRVEAIAMIDPRFAILGELSWPGRSKGSVPDSAFHQLGLGMMIGIWSYCTERNCASLSEKEVRFVTGSRQGLAHIIESGLGKSDEQQPLTVQIAGAQSRIGWLEKKRNSARIGGSVSQSAKASGTQSAKASGTQSAKASGRRLVDPTVTVTATVTAKENTILASAAEVSEVSPAELEEIYKIYPVKKGKKPGMAKIRRAIKTQDDLATLRKCVETMAEAWSSPKANSKFCPHFSTFANQELWLDDEWPMPSLPTAPEHRGVPEQFRPKDKILGGSRSGLPEREPRKLATPEELEKIHALAVDFAK